MARASSQVPQVTASIATMQLGQMLSLVVLGCMQGCFIRRASLSNESVYIKLLRLGEDEVAEHELYGSGFQLPSLWHSVTSILSLHENCSSDPSSVEL